MSKSYILKVDVRVSFSRDKTERMAKMTIFGLEQENVCKKIDALTEKSQNLKSFEGKYYSSLVASKQTVML